VAKVKLDSSIIFFNPKNLDLVIHFPFGEQLVEKINLLAKNIIKLNVRPVSQENAAQMIAMWLNEFYELLFNLLPINIDSETLNILQSYDDSLAIASKKRCISKIKKINKSFFKTYPYLKNLNYLNLLAGIYIGYHQLLITNGIKDILQKEKNKNRAKLKENDKRLKYYREVENLNKEGKSEYKAARIISKKYDLDFQSFYSAYKGWAKRNKVSRNKHR
jgi:hypothetical protein